MTAHTWIGESRGIRIRRFVPADISDWRRWLQPDEEWHLWDGPYYATVDPGAADAAAERMAASLEDGTYDAESPAHRAVVVTAEEPEVMIGLVSWHWEAEESDWRRMGVAVFEPALRGKGVGTEALRIWTDHLFATTRVVRLDYSTWSGNERMLAVGRRLGFTEEARFRDARDVRGERYDSVVMGILRSEWDAASDHSSPVTS